MIIQRIIREMSSYRKDNAPKRFLSIFILVFFLFSCNHNKHILNPENLLNRYNSPEDSLKRKAVAFLLENMTGQVSEIPDSVSISSAGIIPDNLIVDNQLLLDNINIAFETWNKYPWANSVPKDVFFNYLLPYKIYGEEPDNWREYFFNKYRDSIRIFQKTDSLHDINTLYYRILEYDIDKWFIYADKPALSTPHPGLNQLLHAGSGDCYGWSYLNVMILRSFGIPATIDNIPLWGRKNGSHSTEVFWNDEKQKLSTASGRGITFPAKVFRYTYKIQNNWTDSIEPVIKQKTFLLNFLKHNHWIDATHEHTQTATVDYPCNITTDFAYICVCNYGKWLPIYWGKVKTDGKACFENMGTDLLYRIALPKENTYEIISPVFHVDSIGNKTFFKPDDQKLLTLHLSKLNTGSRSWVEKDKIYNLYYADEKSNWILFKTQQCEMDSLITFEKIPSGTLYQLRDIEEKRRLERIFTYENGQQIFW